MSKSLQVNGRLERANRTGARGPGPASAPAVSEPPPATEYTQIPDEQFEALLERVLTEDDELLRRLA